MTAIAAIGNLTLDGVAGAPPRPGGAVFYAARTLASLEADALIAASCAPEDRTALLPAVESFGLPVAWYASRSTAAYTFHYEGDRRIMRQEAVGGTWSAGQAVEAVGDAHWIHVGALVRTDFPEETLAALSSGGRRLLVDAQGLVRTADLGPLHTDGNVTEALRPVSILKLDDHEAETLAGSTEPEALRALGVPEVLLTFGSGGSCLVTADVTERVPAPHISGSIDPTGAGDIFSAAYLAARAAGFEPVEAATRATTTVGVMLAGS